MIQAWSIHRSTKRCLFRIKINRVLIGCSSFYLHITDLKPYLYHGELAHPWDKCRSNDLNHCQKLLLSASRGDTEGFQLQGNVLILKKLSLHYSLLGNEVILLLLLRKSGSYPVEIFMFIKWWIWLFCIPLLHCMDDHI